MAEPEILPKVAVMTLSPITEPLVARPLDPGALLIVATAVLDELQVTEVVISCVVLSE